MDTLDIREITQKAAGAARLLSLMKTEAKNGILTELALALGKHQKLILAANEKDIFLAKEGGMADHLIDRLALSEARLDELSQSVLQVKNLPDPVGAVEDEQVLESGLAVSRLRIPLGLIAFICEARPGALIEAGALTLKTGNGIIIKCGREMAHTAAALAETFGVALKAAQAPVAAVTVIPSLSREELKELLTFSELIDLVIPRGGEGLIRFVSENSRIPVLKHFKGVCHLYLDQGADLSMALKLVINGKTQRPSTCNSLECLLVHQEEAAAFLPRLAESLTQKGVTLKADPQALALIPGATPATEEDWGQEFLNLTLAVKVVSDYQAALNHIAQYGSNHTEVIVTCDPERGRNFQWAVEAGCVMVNASPRLNDGGCLGLGAEIGISTTRLHAYGPMGLKELTTTRFIVCGQGHERQWAMQ